MVSLAPASCELETAGNHSPVTFVLNKTLVKATEDLLGLDILSNSSLNACCGYKSANLDGKLCLWLWYQALHVSEFKVSGPVVAFNQGCFSRFSCSHITLYSVITVEYQTEPDNLWIQLRVRIKYLLM